MTGGGGWRLMPVVMIVARALTKRFPCSIASAQQGRGSPRDDRGNDRAPSWFTAVDWLTFDLRTGEILTLLGPKGAGKTTTIRMLGSTLRPGAGWARVAGFDTVHQVQQARRVLGLLREFPGLYLQMRADEYLAFLGRVQGLSRNQVRRRAGVLMERLELSEVRSRRLADNSKGLLQKLALIRAMIHDPPILLLDEPTSVMDPYSAKLVRDAILHLRHGGDRSWCARTAWRRRRCWPASLSFSSPFYRRWSA